MLWCGVGIVSDLTKLLQQVLACHGEDFGIDTVGDLAATNKVFCQLILGVGIVGDLTAASIRVVP